MRRIGYALLAAASVAVFFRSPLAPAIAFLLAVLASLLLDRSVLRSVLRAGLLLAVVFAAAVTAAVVAWTTGPARGVALGSGLLLRLLVLALGAALLARLVEAEALLALARRLRLERLGLVLGLAINALPHLTVVVHEVWISLRGRRRGLQLVCALPALAEVLLAHTARVADEATAAACLRGHSALVRVRLGLRLPLRTVVVTGLRGSGKTGAVVEAARRLRAAGAAIAGFAQPGTWAGGERVSFELVDLVTGETAPLARRVEPATGEHGTPFHFEAAGLALGKRSLARVAPGAVVLVDEVGPVELRGHGHMAALRQALSVPNLEGAVLAVRRSLAPSLVSSLELEDVVVVEVERHQDPAGAILAALASTGASPPR